MKMTKGERTFQIFDVILLTIVILITVYPIWYIFIISITDVSAGSTSQIVLLPGELTLDSYKAVFQNEQFVNGFLVSAIRVGAGVGLTLLFCSMLSYTLIQPHFIGRSTINVLVVVAMFVSGGMIPFFLVVRSFGLVNNIWGLIIPFAYDSYGVILMRNYFKGIPPSLQESARIDGANEFQIFSRIILPTSVPILATMTLFWAVWFWNDYIYASFLVTKKQLFPVQLVLLQVINNVSNASLMSKLSARGVQIRANGESMKMAAIMLSIVPILIVYPFLQKYFVHGITLGSVKE
ncbi:carbohydrate ABC transporter permease [Eubacteriales bacterium OttesenSCG-928-N13]|nr:carbohydrate ABC transporter permease [Eubacteriales bacterium OttesenSCG-928-N13]